MARQQISYDFYNTMMNSLLNSIASYVIPVITRMTYFSATQNKKLAFVLSIPQNTKREHHCDITNAIKWIIEDMETGCLHSILNAGAIEMLEYGILSKILFVVFSFFFLVGQTLQILCHIYSYVVCMYVCYVMNTKKFAC